MDSIFIVPPPVLFVDGGNSVFVAPKGDSESERENRSRRRKESEGGDIRHSVTASCHALSIVMLPQGPSFHAKERPDMFIQTACCVSQKGLIISLKRYLFLHYESQVLHFSIYSQHGKYLQES